MSNTTPTPQQAQDDPQAGAQQAGDTNAGENPTTPTPAQQGGAQGVDELPEWAQRELRGAREEAAKYRTSLREAEDRLGELSKSSEEAASLREELRIEREQRERERRVAEVMREHKLPGKARRLLMLASDDDFDSVVEDLVEVVKPEEQPLGGRTPRSPSGVTAKPPVSGGQAYRDYKAKQNRTL